MEDTSSNNCMLDLPNNPSAPGLKTLGYQNQRVTTSTMLKSCVTDDSVMHPCCFINFPTLNKAVLSFCIINFVFGFILCTLSVLLLFSILTILWLHSLFVSILGLSSILPFGWDTSDDLWNAVHCDGYDWLLFILQNGGNQVGINKEYITMILCLLK